MHPENLFLHVAGCSQILRFEELIPSWSDCLCEMCESKLLSSTVGVPSFNGGDFGVIRCSEGVIVIDDIGDDFP
jgi:hypothetical protein